MRKLYSLLSLIPVLALAQSTDQNYIKTTAYKVATQNGISQTVGGAILTDANKIVNLGYFDGLGRPIQQIAYKQSAEGKNIIVPIVYDALGRKTRDYLPFPSQSTSLLYTDNATIIPQLVDLYEVYFGTDGENPYSEKQLESSPLNRVQKQSAPGADWALPVLPSDPDHTIRFEYLNNSANEVVLFTAVSSSPSAGQYSISLFNSTYYPAGELYKTRVKNENWKTGDNHNNTTEEFKDKQGRVVLKRSYESGFAHDTYYVYDQNGNLTYVIPPKVNTGQSVTNAILDGLCYQYKYDHRNRLVEKKLPGKQWEYIVYDRMDRVVATGPANAPFTDLMAQGKQGWLITKYDAFNRTVLTGWISTDVVGTGRAAFQNNYDGLTVMNESRSAVSTWVSGVEYGYSNNVWPYGSYHVLTVNYYDDYGFMDQGQLPTNVEGSPVINATTEVTTKGLPTGNWIRVLESTTSYQGEINYTLYDSKSRPISIKNSNHMGGYTTVNSKYNFQGQVLYTTTSHLQSVGNDELVIREDFEYTDQGRLLTHMHKINSGQEEILSENHYNLLGQLELKKVGTNSSSMEPLQHVDFTYNIRGWLKSINEVGSLEGGSNPDLFGFLIGYNDMGNPLYNGNISQTQWITATDNVLRQYDYSYDVMNRLLNASYSKPNHPTDVGSYDEGMHYDANGNIDYLYRYGYVDGDSGSNYLIDDLNYHYESDSNKLLTVTDHTNSLDGFRDGQNPNEGRPDYEYDSNGNMTEDWNKGISRINYNHLNLPTVIVFETLEGGDNVIEYLYNAAGVKLRKRVVTTTPQQGTAVLVTDYVGGFQYVDSMLQFFPTSEGYVNVIEGQLFNYVYSYKDHLGNIRLNYSWDENENIVKTLEESHFYPFGMKHTNYNDNKHDYVKNEDGTLYALIEPVVRNKYQYKYNGKEYQDELGLNMYDYGARNYDPAVGRFFSIDRMSEMFMNLSPYQYAGNTPTYFIDMNGEYIYINDPGSGNQYRYENGQTQHQVDGKWQAIDASVVLSDFVLNTVAGLSGLESSGKTGSGIVKGFYGDKMDVTFSFMADTPAHAKNGVIGYDPSAFEKTWTTEGYTSSPLFVTLGHEMAHVNDPTKFHDSWYHPKVSEGEIRATHVENKIRAESGLPLRTHYGDVVDKKTKEVLPDWRSRIIDNAGNSIYYNRSNKRYTHHGTPQSGQAQATLNDVVNATNGRTLTGRFNYYGK